MELAKVDVIIAKIKRALDENFLSGRQQVTVRLTVPELEAVKWYCELFRDEKLGGKNEG